jgi:hypothetical protein
VEYSPDRPLQGTALDGAVDPDEKTKLPFSGRQTGFLRKPNTELSAC